MICRLNLENFMAFGGKVEMDFFANGNIKRFDYNHIDLGGKSVLKTVGFYGPNNTGKTCVLMSLLAVRALMKNEPHGNFANSFAGKGSITSFEVEYAVDGRFYSYSVQYDNALRKYIHERLSSKTYKDGSVSNEVIFERSETKLSWLGMSPSFKKTDVIRLFSLSLPFMVVFDDASNKTIGQAKRDYLSFADSILFLDMDAPLNISKTIGLMQTDPKASKFIKEFVKNCDLHIDDFGFDEHVQSDANIEEQLKAASTNPAFPKETLKFFSKHNGYRVPSVFFDSVGTMKLVALAGYIYDSLTKGRTLIVDEIDSSLHHILTRSIVAMFNNMLNVKAQLLFTTHDVLLLDLKELLRKDQVYLVDVEDRGSSTVYRMSDRFTARSENGIRGSEEITEYYLKGQFGAIPTPDLFSSLEDALSDE